MHSLLQANVTSLLLNVDQPVMFACSALTLQRAVGPYVSTMLYTCFNTSHSMAELCI